MQAQPFTEEEEGVNATTPRRSSVPADHMVHSIHVVCPVIAQTNYVVQFGDHPNCNFCVAALASSGGKQASVSLRDRNDCIQVPLTHAPIGSRNIPKCSHAKNNPLSLLGRSDDPTCEICRSHMKLPPLVLGPESADLDVLKIDTKVELTGWDLSAKLLESQKRLRNGKMKETIGAIVQVVDKLNMTIDSQSSEMERQVKELEKRLRNEIEVEAAISVSDALRAKSERDVQIVRLQQLYDANVGKSSNNAIVNGNNEIVPALTPLQYGLLKVIQSGRSAFEMTKGRTRKNVLVCFCKSKTNACTFENVQKDKRCILHELGSKFAFRVERPFDLITILEHFVGLNVAGCPAEYALVSLDKVDQRVHDEIKAKSYGLDAKHTLVAYNVQLTAIGLTAVTTYEHTKSATIVPPPVKQTHTEARLRRPYELLALGLAFHGNNDNIYFLDCSQTVPIMPALVQASPGILALQKRLFELAQCPITINYLEMNRLCQGAIALPKDINDIQQNADFVNDNITMFGRECILQFSLIGGHAAGVVGDDADRHELGYSNSNASDALKWIALTWASLVEDTRNARNEISIYVPSIKSIETQLIEQWNRANVEIDRANEERKGRQMNYKPLAHKPKPVVGINTLLECHYKAPFYYGRVTVFFSKRFAGFDVFKRCVPYLDPSNGVHPDRGIPFNEGFCTQLLNVTRHEKRGYSSLELHLSSNKTIIVGVDVN